MMLLNCGVEEDSWESFGLQWDPNSPEGWDGEEGGRGVQDGEHMYTHGWFMSMYGKNDYTTGKVISLQLKINKFIFK